MGYYQDIWGNYVFNDGTPLDMNDLIARGIDVLGAWSSHSPYVSPDDPRYQQQYPQRYPQQYPVGGYPNAISPGGVNTQGFQINWWAAAGIGLLVGVFFAGRRGR